jgi:hypothetical protein
MTSSTSNNFIVFTLGTREAFSQHLRENPNNRRVSRSDKDILIEWLTNPLKRPSSQEEFSRRNYVRKSFAWDEKTQTLLAVTKKDGGKDRTVVTTDMIVDVVETVHTNNGHAGWDATWKDVSTSYYGILRSDVIFLLKQCHSPFCAENPSKRPKGSAAIVPHSQLTDHELLDFLATDEVPSDNRVEWKDNDYGSVGKEPSSEN